MLYLLEENTSYVVLFSSGLGLIIEFWKLTQAMSVSVDFSRGYPRLRLADKASYSCVPLSGQTEVTPRFLDRLRTLEYSLIAAIFKCGSYSHAELYVRYWRS